MTTNTSTAARTNASQNNSPQNIAPGSGANNSPDLLAFTTPHPVDQHEIQFDISQRRKGVCKFFNSQKGFGFINDDHPEELGNQEVFVHYTSIGSKGGFRSLAEGEEVEYVVAPGQKGFQATEVTGPSGRAVQGDVKSKLPKTPTFVPYPMGIMPAGAYAIAGAGSPYMQPDPYMSAQGVYGSPYAGQVFYVPSAVGVLPGAHSPNLAAVSSYPTATSPHPSIRSPTIPFTHHQHGQMAMALSPQPGAGGFGFRSPSMAYGFGGPASAGVVGTSATGSAAAAEMRSPLMSSGANSGVVGQGGFGTAQASQSAFGVGSHNHGLGLRGDTNAGVGSSTEQIHHRGGPSGSSGAHHHQLGGFTNGGPGGSLLYTTTSGVPVNHQ